MSFGKVRWPTWRMDGAALAAALAAVFLWAALAAAGSARADSRAVEQFLEQYLAGCVRQSGTRGHDRLRGHAWCTCAVAQLRMEGSEAALEELARRVARGEPIDHLELFKRATRNRGRCDAIGTHDAGPPDRLERSRSFGAFTIALPPGFLLLGRSTTPAGASYAFHRLHEDLRTAATLEMVVRRVSKEDRAGNADADEFRLRGLLDELARSRSNFRLVETGEAAAGNLRFRRARWRAAEAGDPVIGEVYAGGSGDAVVLIRLQDRERFASRTMPAMRAALATLRLR